MMVVEWSVMECSVVEWSGVEWHRWDDLVMVFKASVTVKYGAGLNGE